MRSRTLSKEKIIAAAVELIDEQETLTFTKLSRKLGMRSQGIYNYYPDIMSIRIAVAVDFYNNLAVRLQADLLGLTGKQAIKAFANVSVQYALGKFLVTQQILDLPAEQLQDEALKESLVGIQSILNQLLVPYNTDKKSRLIITRMLRNLIDGEIMHVGSGRFTDKTINARDSFDQMLTITLAEL